MNEIGLTVVKGQPTIVAEGKAKEMIDQVFLSGVLVF